MSRWNQLVDALSTREIGTSLALFRILIGLVVVCELVLLQSSGALGVVFAGGPWTATSDNGLVILLGGPSLQLVHGLVVLTFFTSAMIVVGAWTRVAAALCWATMTALFSVAHGGGSYDALLTIALLLLVVSRSDATLSIACRRRTGTWTSSELVPAWPRYVAIYQLALLYTTSAMAKLGAEWLPAGDFAAVFNALLSPAFARSEWTFLGWLYPLTQVGTAVSWLWEFTWFAVPLALLFSRPVVRNVYVGIGILMHLTLWVLLNLGPFSPLVLSFYVLLYRPAEWRALVPASIAYDAATAKAALPRQAVERHSTA